MNEEKTSIEQDLKDSKVRDVEITQEMKTSFLEYAMSVIVSRALPDIRDGLKPVHRRIIYGMNELGVFSDKPHKKCARITGDVMGKYHPHGDASIYDALVRMAQDFSYRHPLVDGHGNFGSIDGDEAAAMRYTEARLSKISNELIRDIDKDTVDFIDNYDASEREPVVLPAKFPNLLINGSTGIAVGMATNIPPHNLAETIEAFVAYINNPDLSVLELMDYIHGPDFPTGASIIGLSGIKRAFETGNGSFIIRSEIHKEEKKNKSLIVITEIPYEVNKSKLIERIAQIVKLDNSPLKGIIDLADESNRSGIRIVISVKKDANADVIINNLYKHTQVQQSYSYNMVVIDGGRPKTVNLIDIFRSYLKFQLEIIVRRTKFDLEKALARKHILAAYTTVFNDLDHAIELIKTSKDASEAASRLKDEYNFTDLQTKAILALPLQRLTSLEIEKIRLEEHEIDLKIIDYKAIIENVDLQKEIIKNEILELKSRYATPRKTTIIIGEDYDIEDESLITKEDMVITITAKGYIKRLSLNEYRVQGRGGVGVKGANLTEEDVVTELVYSNTHIDHLIFTTLGRVYKIRGYKIPISSKTSKGLTINNLINFQDGENYAGLIKIDDIHYDNDETCLIFVTKKGIIKRSSLKDYSTINSSGKIAITLKEDDEVVNVLLSNGQDSIMIASADGYVNRFSVSQLRVISRTGMGVIGKRIGEDNEIISAVVINDDHSLLVVSKNGYAKVTDPKQYRETSRGSKGVISLKRDEKTGPICAMKVVDGELSNLDLLAVTTDGIVIRTPLSDISESSRTARGVRTIKLRPDSYVSTVILIPHQEKETTSEEEEKK
ncbi:MAG: DNA gyrase subunit A [Acholeplasmatales bacterium]|jgi:DNA gyrase subunit A|nr:DNA gyrase subunit A [Acholeplasmatales bacterium]